MRSVCLVCLLLILCCGVPAVAATDDYLFVASWGGAGTDDGQFFNPIGIAVDAATSTVYVADTLNNRVQTFNASGGHIATWGEYGSDDGRLYSPHGIAVDAAGNTVYLVDTFNHRIQKFAANVSEPKPGVVAVPGGTGIPIDTDADGLYDDVNGNGRKDFADIVLYFIQMGWISTNEPVVSFDYNGNSRVDFADVIWLFMHL